MISYFFLVFQFVFLSFWIGGSATLLMIVAPQIFQRGPLNNAGLVFNPVLKKYLGVLAVILVLFIGTLFLQLIVLTGSVNLKLRLALSISSLATLLTVYNRFSIMPQIDELHSKLPESPDDRSSEERTAWYRRALGRSLVLFSLNLFLGLCVVIILILPF